MRVKGDYVNEHLWYWVISKCVINVWGHPSTSAKIYLAFDLFPDYRSMHTLLSEAYGYSGLLKMSKVFSKGRQHGA